MTQNTVKQPQEQERAKTPDALEIVVSRMFHAMVGQKTTPQFAKNALLNWYNSMSPEEQTNFRSDSDTVNSVMKRCEGAIDSIKQEIGYLIHSRNMQG